MKTPTLITESGEAKLVNAQTLLELLWEENSRPSMRSLRSWTAQRIIPCIRCGGLVYYDPGAVREALAKRCVKTLT